MLLVVVPEAQAVAGYDLARVRSLRACEQAQQRGLAGAVQAEYDDAGTPVDREVDVGEDLQ